MVRGYEFNIYAIAEDETIYNSVAYWIAATQSNGRVYKAFTRIDWTPTDTAKVRPIVHLKSDIQIVKGSEQSDYDYHFVK